MPEGLPVGEHLSQYLHARVVVTGLVLELLQEGLLKKSPNIASLNSSYGMCSSSNSENISISMINSLICRCLLLALGANLVVQFTELLPLPPALFVGFFQLLIA